MGKTTIYYFTGTGNSLNAARMISGGLKGSELKSIAQIMKQGNDSKGNFTSSSKKIGIVFPVVAWGAPLIVEEFIKKFNFTKDQYIFTIATCGGTPAGSNILLDKIIRSKGNKISAGYVVKSKAYRISNDSSDIIPIKIAKTLAGKSRARIKGIDQRLTEIIGNIQGGTVIKLEGSNAIANLYGNMLHSQIVNVFKTESKNFWMDEKCNNCGVCEEICPTNNIYIDTSGKHVWKGNCQACYACLQWCPEFAIQYKEGSKTIKRCQNSEVKLKDML